MAKKKTKSKLQDTFLQLDDLGCRLITDMQSLDGSYVLSTGIFPLDLILSKKLGLLPGKVIELFGPTGTGKTSVALCIAAEAIKNGLQPYYFNVERAINSSILDVFNLQPKNKDGNLYVYNTDDGEAALNGIKRILQTQSKPIIILDSVANCIPSNQFSEEIGKPTYHSSANIISPFIGQAKNLCEKSEGILILLNQQRANVTGYGKKTKEPGGYALKFNCDWRIELKRGSLIEQDQFKIGHTIKATTIKNRFNIPLQEAIFHLIYGKGFDYGMDLVELAIQFGVMERSGAWLKMPDDNKIHGSLNAAKEINKNEKLRNLVKDKITEIVM